MVEAEAVVFEVVRKAVVLEELLNGYTGAPTDVVVEFKSEVVITPEADVVVVILGELVVISKQIDTVGSHE